MDALTPPPVVVPPLLVAPLALAFPFPFAKLMLGIAIAPFGAMIPLMIEA
jgi:hypothetical protein